MSQRKVQAARPGRESVSHRGALGRGCATPPTVQGGHSAPPMHVLPLPIQPLPRPLPTTAPTIAKVSGRVARVFFRRVCSETAFRVK